MHNFDRVFPLKWRTTVRTKLLRTLTLLRIKVSCGISFRGECLFRVCLSLRSAVKTAAVCGAERKRVLLGGDTKCFSDSSFFLSPLMCPENYSRLAALPRSENSDLSALWLPSQLWSFLEILLHSVTLQHIAITRHSGGHVTIH